MQTQERISIIIDGSNFYHRLKETGLTHLIRFNYKAFSDFLARERAVSSRTYYIGAVREDSRNEKSREFMRNQQRLVGILARDGWTVELGDLLKTDGVYHKKGVDVRMAVDLLVGAYEDKYDAAILVSSDTDLIPALMKVRSMGKQIEYVGFSHKPSHALINHSDIRRLLTKEDLETFLIENA